MTVWGLAELQWIAATAVATAVLAMLTAGTLIVIWQQLTQSRRANVQDTIERATNVLLPYRASLFDLSLRKKVEAAFNIDELSKLREIHLSYELFLGVVEFSVHQRGLRNSMDLVSIYMADSRKIYQLIRCAMDSVRKMVDEYKQKVTSRLGELLKLLNCSEEDAAYVWEKFESRAGDEEIGRIFDALFVKYADGANKSLQSLVEKSEKSQEFLPAGSLGGDDDSAAVSAWTEELDGMLSGALTLNERVDKLLRGGNWWERLILRSGKGRADDPPLVAA